MSGYYFSEEQVYKIGHSLKRKDAQLLQRDRAAGCVLFFAKSRNLELVDNILRTLYRSIFNHCDIIGQKICKIRWKNAK